jgi:protein TonB
MEIQSILPGYLEVLFHGRNKAYGGYELRVNYPYRARNGALYAFLVTAIVLGGLMMPVKQKAKISGPYHLTDGPLVFHTFEESPKPPVVEPHHASAPAAPKVHTDVFTQPVIVTNNTPDPKLLAPVTQVNAQPAATSGMGANVPTGSATGNGHGVATDVETGNGLGSGDGKPFKYVEQMPEFSGDINSYLAANMRYPEAAREAGTAGKVVIRFIVNEDGSISGAEIIRGIGGGCDEEALRVIKSMPKWKPGKQNGRAVKVYFMLPVLFVLQ